MQVVALSHPYGETIVRPHWHVLQVISTYQARLIPSPFFKCPEFFFFTNYPPKFPVSTVLVNHMETLTAASTHQGAEARPV